MSLFGSTYQLDGPSEPTRYAPSSRRFRHGHKARKPRKPRRSHSPGVPPRGAGSSRAPRLPRATPTPPSAANSRPPSFPAFPNGAAPAPAPRRAATRGSSLPAQSPGAGPASRFAGRPPPPSDADGNSSARKGPSRLWEKDGGAPLWGEAEGVAVGSLSELPASPTGRTADDRFRGAISRLGNTIGNRRTHLENVLKVANGDGDGEGGSGGRRYPAYLDEPMDYDELFGSEDEREEEGEQHQQKKKNANFRLLLELDDLPDELKTAVLKRVAGLCTLRRNTAAMIRELPEDPDELPHEGSTARSSRWPARWARRQDCRDGHDPRALRRSGVLDWLRERRPDLRVGVTRVPGPPAGASSCANDFDTWAWL